MKILNLYAGIGGNRKLWGDEHKITAVEYRQDIADVYNQLFPNDTVIVADAHRYLLETIRQNPGIQNDDARLVAAVWRRKGWDDGVSLEDNIRRMPRSESITRRRRELHDKGLITYSPTANRRREEAFRNERDHASPATRRWSNRDEA